MVLNKVYFLKINRSTKNIAIIFCLILTFTLFQDFLHSHFNNYSFFLSEALLFKTFWLLFIPILILQSRFLIFLNENINQKQVVYTLGVLLPTLLHLCVFPFVIWLLSGLFFNHTYTYHHTFSYTLSEDFYKYLIIYCCAMFVHFYLKRKSKRLEEKVPNLLQKLIFNNGRNYISVAINEILYINTSAPYIVIHTQKQQYLYASTLKLIEEKLDQQQFVRVHKSTIINLNMVVSYHSRLNGDFDILLINRASIRLSRNYAPAFKKIYHSHSL